MLAGHLVTLRELRVSDAAALCALLTTKEVTRFISPPPTTVEGFERFIARVLEQQAEGSAVCFAVTVQGFDTAIGLFQVRLIDPTSRIAECGVALGSPFWGTGVFVESARLALTFAFDTLDVRRLEARAAIRNGRAIGALQKLGAVREAVLRSSLRVHGEVLDQHLYAILADDWRLSRDYHLEAPRVS